MLERIEMAPPDPILGLTEAFQKETNPRKVNLGVGVYKDVNGQTPVLESVRQAGSRIVATEKTKSYLPISGSPQYAAHVQNLMFGPGHEIVISGRAATAHTPGGTGGLRVAADFLRFALPNAKMWMSAPTWENHKNVFTAAGLPLESYPYYNMDAKALDFEKMLNALKQVPAGDAVLLHGCCHNPSGMDPRPEQWEAIADVAAKQGWLPFVDFAYQGFGDSLEHDATGLRAMCAKVKELLVVSSFSKNFGLYNERVGAVTAVGANAEVAAKAMSQIKRLVRANYSNPPAHGAAIVTAILGDEELRAIWMKELTEMRDRINGMRRLFADTLKAKGAPGDYSFIVQQRGMFSFSGLNKQQVEQLRDKYAIYIVGSGRINVAGMTPGNMNYICDAIIDVLKH